MKYFAFFTLVLYSTYSPATLLDEYDQVSSSYEKQNHSKASELRDYIQQIVHKDEPKTEQALAASIDPFQIAKLKKELQQELANDYLDSLIKKLGPCRQSPCLQKKNSYLQLQLERNANICFPNTDCGFYQCMEDKYQCMGQGFEYFKQLAFPTCSNYVKRVQQNKFSALGVDWIYRVMVCLQKGLVDECDKNGNCPPSTPQESCRYMTEFTLNFHPGCYINSGVGICQLPIKDQLSIWRTVEPFLTKRERKEAFKVMWHCLTKGGKTSQ